MSKLPQSIDLTAEEFEYLALNIKKLKEHRDKFPDKLSSVFDGNALNILYKILVEDKLKSFKMRRRERRLLQIHFSAALERIEKSIIPGYKKRMITPKSKAKYEPYWKSAKHLRKLTASLVQKLNEGL